MKAVLLSTSDSNGGAAIACLRVALALKTAGIDVKVLVIDKKSLNDFVCQLNPWQIKIGKYIRHAQYAWEIRKITSPGYVFSNDPWWGLDISEHPDIVDADVIQLHWINQGFLGLPQLERLFELGKPITWHMHDFWPFTGGCHYPGSCRSFEESCGNCPALRKSSSNDLSKVQWSKKYRIFRNNAPVLVGASAWLTSEARRSSLGLVSRIEHIPNPIDTTRYFPGNKNKAREHFNIDQQSKVLLFAAMNPADIRKGYRQLEAALEIILHNKEQIILLVVGKIMKNFTRNLPFPTILAGPLNADGMRIAYQASDVFVMPSLEENLPNTVLESISCGTPVAGFQTGGVPEMIDHAINGYLATIGDVEGLANAIESIINHQDPNKLRDACLSKVYDSFLPHHIGQAYLSLFEEIVQSRNN
jgi:glycosyltransferase involved in cell wall biosynthesis